MLTEYAAESGGVLHCERLRIDCVGNCLPTRGRVAAKHDGPGKSVYRAPKKNLKHCVDAK